jgi:hypothetical protein
MLKRRRHSAGGRSREGHYGQHQDSQARTGDSCPFLEFPHVDRFLSFDTGWVLIGAVIPADLPLGYDKNVQRI